MNRWLVAALFAVPAFLGTGILRAQDNYDAQWIWADAGDPAQEAAKGKVWFRTIVRTGEPATGAARILCDDHFVLWVNGQKVGEGGGKEISRFNLNGIVAIGPNVIAIEATNNDGKAGLFVDGEVRTQGGTPIPFDTGAAWKATDAAPEGDAWLAADFNADAWKAVKVIGPHAESPWKEIALQDSFLDRYALAPGFEIERIGEPELVGSLVAMTWGNDGRLIGSPERGPIMTITDQNGDGKYDHAEPYCNEVTNCQGLCMVGDVLYAVGEGMVKGPGDGDPKEVAGLFLLPDRDNNGVADEVVHLHTFKGGMGEHGPHDVVFGPDGELYFNVGNHGWVNAEPEANSPIHKTSEDYLLQPPYEDARGHAVGIKAPGGTVWRFSPDGKKWWTETVGFRNHYDIAFNAAGDLYTFDSDMEWDINLPWYRPVRVNHCIPGAEFGWRSGAANWPPYYFDSLPETADVKRGSPTGVVFYEHNQFPEKYRGSYLVCDWSMGRILAVFLEQKGATYAGKVETLVSGNPLNVSDIEVDRDGSVVFATGGRNTEGGVYRIRHTGSEAKAVKAESIKDLLQLPQLHAAWSREMVADVKKTHEADWDKTLKNTVGNGSPAEKVQALTLLSQFGPKPTEELLLAAVTDSDATVRRFATWLIGNHSSDAVKAALTKLLGDSDPIVQRRACEAFTRSGLVAPADSLIKLLESEDHWLRFAARLSLERVPVDQWKSKVLASKNVHVVTNGLLALHRAGGNAKGEALPIEAKLLAQDLGPELRLDVLRMIQLTLFGGERGPAIGDIAQNLLAQFPSGNPILDMEASRVLAVLQSPETAEELVTALEADKSQTQQIHYALTLAYVENGWTTDLRNRLINWYEKTRTWEGGHSFTPYLANIVGGSVKRFTPQERKLFLEQWAQHPFASGLIVSISQPDEIADFESVILAILNDGQSGANPEAREKLVSDAIEALGRKASPGAANVLRTLYDQFPDRREMLARSLASYPTLENVPYFIRSLSTTDGTTLQLALKALQKADSKTLAPADLRAVIIAGLRLNEQGQLAVELLRRVTENAGGADDRTAAGQDALKIYQTWFSTTYPNEPLAELPQDSAEDAKYTYQQLVEYLDQNPAGHQGDVGRGKEVFTKAQCVKCHKFGSVGEGIGPDLTSVRRRFQRKEIIESILYPSQVISDQYRMVTVITVDGLQHNGMPLKTADDSEKVTLLLSDATKIEVAKEDVDETVPSKTSVMPASLLKTLTLEDIADLFAFLETSKFNEDPANPAQAAAK